MPYDMDTLPREEYTIAGNTFSIIQPFSEGHVLSSGQASALNQTFAENIRNNLAKKVAEAIEAGTFDAQVFQGVVDDYMESYEFGVRTGGGGRTGDPVKSEAMDIARGLVRKALVKAGKVLKDIPAKKITELASGVLAKGDAKAEEIMALARQRVEATKDVEDLVLDFGADTQAEESAAAEGNGRRKRGEATDEG